MLDDNSSILNQLVIENVTGILLGVCASIISFLVLNVKQFPFTESLSIMLENTLSASISTFEFPIFNKLPVKGMFIKHLPSLNGSASKLPNLTILGFLISTSCPLINTLPCPIGLVEINLLSLKSTISIGAISVFTISLSIEVFKIISASKGLAINKGLLGKFKLEILALNKLKYLALYNASISSSLNCLSNIATSFIRPLKIVLG